MPQKKVTLRTRKPRDGEIRHYVNTRLAQLIESTERTTRRIVAEEIAGAVTGLEGYVTGAVTNLRRDLTEKINSAIATVHLGKVQIVNENCTAITGGLTGCDCRTMGYPAHKWCPSCKEFASNQTHLGKLPMAHPQGQPINDECTGSPSIRDSDCRDAGLPYDKWCQSCCTFGLYAVLDARPPEPVSSPDIPYVLISIRHGRTDLAKTIGKVDVDIFDWDAVKESIENNENRLFSEREVEYLKEQDQSLYNKYMAQKYEASMGPAIVRAKLVENWLEEPNSAVLKALQQRGWVIKPYDKE